MVGYHNGEPNESTAFFNPSRTSSSSVAVACLLTYSRYSRAFSRQIGRQRLILLLQLRSHPRGQPEPPQNPSAFPPISHDERFNRTRSATTFSCSPVTLSSKRDTFRLLFCLGHVTADLQQLVD